MKKLSVLLNKWIDAVLRWELNRLRLKVREMELEDASEHATREKRLAMFDEEAAIHREHYITRLDIDKIELGSKLAAGKFRIKALQYHLEKMK